MRAEKGEQAWLGIDATGIQCLELQTSPDRTVVYMPNLPEGSKPISYGWQFSTVVVLPKQLSSWTAMLDQQGRSVRNENKTQRAILWYTDDH